MPKIDGKINWFPETGRAFSRYSKAIWRFTNVYLNAIDDIIIAAILVGEKRLKFVW